MFEDDTDADPKSTKREGGYIKCIKRGDYSYYDFLIFVHNSHKINIFFPIKAEFQPPLPNQPPAPPVPIVATSTVAARHVIRLS